MERVSTELHDAVHLIADGKARQAKSLCEHLWNLNWNAALPQSIILPNHSAESFSIERSSWSECRDFATRHFSELFQTPLEDHRFNWFDSHPAKATFYETVVDCFLVRSEKTNHSVAMLVANPIDWSTYYIRSVAVLPEYQGNTLGKQLIQMVINTLSRHSVERITIETSVHNHPMNRLLHQMGFTVNGLSLSERWGSLNHFVYFTHPRSRDVFFKNFVL